VWEKRRNEGGKDREGGGWVEKKKGI